MLRPLCSLLRVALPEICGALIGLAIVLALGCGDNEALTATNPAGPPDNDLPRYYGVHLCAAIGCNGTQSVPLWCPSEADPMVPCLCASPTLADEWCQLTKAGIL